ncbi:hypothetical protein [Hyunsoonleella ulvae]|uniref:hypothetical protein n=1 Tax=Hyunsoonleella ulvae TaxID=2799948 RepID=UPI0019397505|nr:hypothetical protein [Hyunsoonleella ulvae]
MLKLICCSYFLLCFAFISHLQAQLGFCGGNSGDPIFIETFGTGRIDSELNPGRTTYSFTQGSPRDGFYKVSSNTNYYGWFITKDHTPNDKDGRCLIVNANNLPEEFFTIPVSGLCENTTYEFTSWLINLFPYYHKVCGYSGNQVANPINVTFEIWDSTNSFIIKQGNTGDIYGSNSPNWQQYGLVFKTAPKQTSVILKMRNNGSSGCGNDLAIDDIMFRTCGDTVIIEDASKNKNSINISQTNFPYTTQLTAIPDFAVFTSHFYQWQKSIDDTNWENIEGATKNNFSIKNLRKTSYYRVLVAEDASNLLNTSCQLISDYFKINIIEPDIKLKRKTKSKLSVNIKENEKAIEELKDSLTVKKKSSKTKLTVTSKLPKTYKEVIIVKDGLNIITDKVWIDGAVGFYVQASEKIIRKGDDKGDIIIDETVYYKSAYGYNSKKRTYTIKVKSK